MMELKAQVLAPLLLLISASCALPSDSNDTGIIPNPTPSTALISTPESSTTMLPSHTSTPPSVTVPTTSPTITLTPLPDEPTTPTKTITATPTENRPTKPPASFETTEGVASPTKVPTPQSFSQTNELPFPGILVVDYRNISGIENGSGLFPYNTVQEGIDAATTGDTIWILPGIYQENVTLRNGINLHGVQGASGTAIHPMAGDAITGEKVTAKIQGLTISSNPSAIGIFGKLSNLHIQQSVIKNNRLGILVIHSPTRNAVIQNNFVFDNVESGIALYSDEQNHGYPHTLVNNNTICANETGIQVESAPEDNTFADITNNILCENHTGLRTLGGSRVVVSYNNVWNNPTHFQITGLLGEGNVATDPKFVNQAKSDYHLLPNSPLIDLGTNASVPVDDFDSEPRPSDGNGDGIAIADIGADEYVPSN